MHGERGGCTCAIVSNAVYSGCGATVLYSFVTSENATYNNLCIGGNVGPLDVYAYVMSGVSCSIGGVGIAALGQYASGAWVASLWLSSDAV